MPEGWIETTLGDIADLELGRTPPRKEDKYWTNDLTRPFCTISDMDAPIVDPKTEGVTELAEEDNKAKRVPAGSLIMSFKLTIGRVGFAARDVFPNEAIVWIEPDPEIATKRFLGFLLESMDLEREAGRAVKGKTLNKGTLKTLEIALPSLAEQARIVDLVEHVDAAIEASNRHAEIVERALGSISESMLNEADAPWVPIEEALADGLFTDGDWVETKDQDPDGSVRLIQLADIAPRTFVDKSDRWMRRDQAEELNCTFLHPNDVLISRMADPIGRAALVPRGIPDCVTAVDVAVARPGEHLDSRYLMYVCNTNYFHSRCLSMQRGTTRKRISRQSLGSIKIPMPSKSDQATYAVLLDELAATLKASKAEARSLRRLRRKVLATLTKGDHVIPEGYDRFLAAEEAA